MKSIEKFIPKEEKFEEKEKLPPNVVMVETPEAKFRIAYGTHSTEQKPEELGKPDALMLESLGLIDYTSSKKLVEEEFDKKVRESIQYRKIIKRAEEKEKPIFLGDITEWESAALLQFGLQFLEPMIGVLLLGSLLRSWVKEKLTNLPKKKLTRREFLKKSISALYFLSDLPGGVIRYLFEEEGILDEKSASRAVERFLWDLNEKIHPETKAIIVTLRNHLMAQKMKTISERLEIQNRKPEVTTVVGAFHHGIEEALEEDDEERVKLVDKLLSVPGLEKTREKIATIARLDFNKEKDGWELTEQFKDPHLLKIEK